MKVIILYRPESEHGRSVENFIREYERRHNNGVLEVLNIDSRDGNAMAVLYDIVQYPAILVVQNDGSAHHIWQGPDLPLLDEVAGYAYA